MKVGDDAFGDVPVACNVTKNLANDIYNHGSSLGKASTLYSPTPI